MISVSDVKAAENLPGMGAAPKKARKGNRGLRELVTQNCRLLSRLNYRCG